MKIVILKYNSGNVRSVSFSLERLGINAIVSDNPDEIKSADKVIFPGVGEASSAMNYLRQYHLDELIVSLKQPVLGICLGMQLLCKYSEEGNTTCLGIVDQDVKKLSNEGKNKVPQVGWNNCYDLRTPLFENIMENSYQYFVHSYYVEVGTHTIGKTKYGVLYSSAIQKDNFYGVQFHPEKSGTIGEQVLKNFINV